MENQTTAQAVPHNSNYVGKVSNLKDISGSHEFEVSIDTLSLTFSAKAFKYTYGFHDFSKQDGEALASYFQIFLKNKFGIEFPLGDLKGGRNFFDHSIPFQDSLGFIAFGGNNKIRKNGVITGESEEKIQLYITGEGCALLNQSNMKKIHAFITEQDANGNLINDAQIKRLDIALDCHTGLIDLNAVRNSYDEGHFNSNGRPPKASYHHDMDSGDGSTFYVGTRTSGKLFRAYEKGKQLGDASSDWVRLEIEIHSKDREISPDTLTNPIPYFAGSYPALNFASAIIEVIKTIKEKNRIMFSDLIVHAQTGYGRLINFMMKEKKYSYEQIVRMLLNPNGYPSRIKWIVHTKNGDIDHVKHSNRNCFN